MLYSWASKWHTSAFWRTCWRKRKTSQSGRTFGLEAESDRLMPLHWHSWLVISLHIDKEYFNNVAGHFENRLCLAAHCALLCLINDVLQSPDLSWHIHHPCLLTSFYAPNDNNISLSSSSEMFHWVWGLWHLATYVWPQSSWYLKLPIGR